MKTTTILKAMLDDGAVVELGILVLPVFVAIAVMLSYLVG